MTNSKKINLTTQQINAKGKLAWEYSPLYNLVKTENSDREKPSLSEFETDKLILDINHPVDIECQPSYDGSVNLILNDDHDKPRIINSGFSLLEDNSYERVSRNQIKATNIYYEDSVNLTTQLQRSTDVKNDALKIALKSVSSGGELKGGNYVFLIKYADDDGNETRFIAESGIVSVSKKYNRSNVLGTLADEVANASVTLELKNVDKSFSKIHVYYRRNYSDLTGTLQREYYKISEPYKITEGDSSSMTITISGIEPVIPVSYDSIIAQHNTYRTVKTQAQVQNMLFFGNVSEHHDDEALLQKLAYQIKIKPTFGNTIKTGADLHDYSNPNNIYDNLGYMPGEYYRLGIVFVYNDESLSQAYNLRGCWYSMMGESNIDDSIKDENINYNNLFINKSDHRCFNTRGIFRMPEIENQLISENSYHTCPIVLEASVPESVIEILKSQLEIRGYFFVRQPRIPLFLGQGLSIGISDAANCPLLHKQGQSEDYGIFSPVRKTTIEKEDGTEVANGYITDNELLWFNSTEKITKTDGEGKDAKSFVGKRSVKVRGLLCSDAFLVPQLQSIFDGSTFTLKPAASFRLASFERYGNDNIYTTVLSHKDNSKAISRPLIYVPPECPSRIFNTYKFSSKCGSSMDIKSSRTLFYGEDSQPKPFLDEDLIRSNFGAYLGVCGEELEIDTVYNIYSQEYPGEAVADIQKYIEKLAFNNTEFYAISDKYYIVDSEQSKIILARGDCFYCESGIKLQYNFLDNQAPLNTRVVESTIATKYGDNKRLFGQSFSKISADGWLELNVSDWNAIHFGSVIAYSHMSNYNLASRAVDDQRTDERALYGDMRTFYPYTIPTDSVNFKIPESSILPMGHSSTLACLPYYVAVQVPFVKKFFDNRIAFSNVQANDSFANSYRVFTGLSYQDIERTYGSIVKLIPLGSSLFCVFEHGCGVVPVNEKALMSTAQGQSIHLYGAQVLQSQVTVVSQDYGSTWEDSIVVTPNGIYGVDTWAKKIWRYNSSGFSIISDQIVQRYLNDNITLSESDIYPIVAVKNVKTHYNNYKGDVMFTFYDDSVCWNLCYNERSDKFVTRYSWTPLLSENIQNSFVSIDRTAVETYSIMAKNMEKGQDKLYLDDPKLDYSKNSHNTRKVRGYFGENGEDSAGKKFGKNVVKNDIGFYNHYDLNLGGFNNMIGEDKGGLVGGIIKSVSYATWDPIAKKVVVHTVNNDEEHCFKHEFGEHAVKIKTASSKEETINLPDKDAMFCIKWGDDFKDAPQIENDPKNVVYYDENNNPYKDETTIEDVEEFYDGETDISEDDVKYIEDPMIDYGVEGEYDHGQDRRIAYNNFKLRSRNYVSVEKGDKLRLEVKLNDFVCWLKINLEVIPYVETVSTWNEIFNYSNYTKLQSFNQTICLIPEYEQLKDDPEVKAQWVENTINYTEAKIAFEKVNRVGFYTHGSAGIYDEINYTDDDPDNEIKPTFWYNKQEPFEFEFVVNNGAGMQKIFDNLAIISNNAEPETLEFSLIGDAYDFNKAGIFKASKVEPIEDEFGIIDSEKTEQERLRVEFLEGKTTKDENFKYSTEFPNTGYFEDKEVTISKDPVLKQYFLHVPSSCRKISEFGRVLGNIEYREDKWLLNIIPIHYQDAVIKNVGGKYSKSVSNIKSTKLRDKWCKVRIKYKGDKLVVISAIQTMFTISYS